MEVEEDEAPNGFGLVAGVPVLDGEMSESDGSECRQRERERVDERKYQ